MNLGNLSNVTAALVGFVSIMLMLSLVVTGVADTIATLTGMRWRSGRRSLIRFLRDELGLDPAYATELADRTYRLPRLGEADSGWEGLVKRLNRIRGARAPLEVGLPEMGAAPKGTTIVWDAASLERLRARMSDDYSKWMKTTSFLLSFVIAFVMQVSTVKLLGDLSVSDEFRTKALEQATKVQVAQQPPLDFEARARSALKELETKFPGAGAALEEVSGVGDSVEEMVEELSVVLKEHPQRDALLKAFNDIWAQQDKQRETAAQAAVLDQVKRLGTLDIRLMEDWSFYFGSSDPKRQPHLLWANILGVLMTGVLLTFGAPFWYEKLRGMQVLQNRLGDVVKGESSGGAKPPPPAPPTPPVPEWGKPEPDKSAPEDKEVPARTPPGKASGAG